MPFNRGSALHAAIGRYAEHAASQAHPELAATRHAVQVAAQHARDAKDIRTAPENARTHLFDKLGLGSLAYTDRPAAQLAAAEESLSKLTLQLTQTQDRISALGREPAIRTSRPGAYRPNTTPACATTNPRRTQPVPQRWVAGTLPGRCW